MLDAGHFVWNAGIFLFCVSAMLAHSKNLVPDMLAAVQAAIDSAREDRNFWHIDDAAWANTQGQSFYYAILEKTEKIACVKFSGGWSDLGDWHTVAGQLPRDRECNFVTGIASQLDCQSTTLWSAANGTQLVGRGLKYCDGGDG